MNNSNLLVAVNFNLTASTKVFNFTDTSNYTGVTASAKLGNLTAIAPNGTTFHNNVSLVSPDITYSVSPTSANFPLASILVGGKLPTGSYVFTYTMTLEDEQQDITIASNNSNAKTIELAGNWVSEINDSSATAFNCVDTLATTPLTIVSATYSAGTGYTTVTVGETLGSLSAFALFQFTVNAVAVNTFTQAYTYVSPAPSLGWIDDSCCSSMTITDLTAYPTGAIVTRLHTVHYPDGMLVPIADILSPLQELTISPIWTGTWTDIFTASFSSTSGVITTLDALRIVEEFLVCGTADECQIYSCLTNIVNKYTESLTTAPSYALNTLQPLLIKAMGLLSAYQLGKKCGEANYTDFLTQITTIANSCGCGCGCSDSIDNTPVQVVGCCGVIAGSDFTIVITSPNGSIGINAVTVGTTTTYDIDVDSAWFTSEFNTLMSTTSINALSDVDTATTTPTPNQVLVWNGTKWVPGSSVGTLVTLSDVDDSGLANNMFLYYDNATSTFKFKLITFALNDLTDVTITTPLSNNILKYNGSAWVNALNLLSLLEDVDVSGITNNQSIAWNSLTNLFEPYTPATALTGLTDVDITTAGLDQSDLLMYDLGSGKWINQAKAVYATVSNSLFTAPFTNTVATFSPVQVKTNIIDGSVSVRGVAANGAGASVVAVTIVNLGSYGAPGYEIPFLCTVGLGSGNPTIGGGSIDASGLVTISWHIAASPQVTVTIPSVPTTTTPSVPVRVAGIPAGNIDLGQIPTWYI